MKELRNLAHLSIVLAVVLWIVACANKPTPALTPVTVQLSWTHQAQFAGFYAADQKGYYAEEGLAVTFVEGGPSTSAREALRDGTAAFGVLSTDVTIARNAGYEINVIYPDDYGIHNYADTILTTDDTISASPNLVLRYLRATLRGWTFAVENPTAIAPMVRVYAPQADAALEAAKMVASIPLINTGEDYIGWMKAEIWAGMERTLRDQGMLTLPLDVTQVYTMQFLNTIYGK